MAFTSTTPGRIFISYRREDTAYPAGWMFDRLAAEFGRNQIFKDVDSIEPGDDFVEVINAAVASCNVVLAVIGKRWLTVTDEQGRRRLDNPDDFVRLEIEAALSRNIRVIPVLVDQARMPHMHELPLTLANLARRNAIELSPDRFGTDAGRLLAVVGRTIQEASSPAREAAQMPMSPPASSRSSSRNAGRSFVDTDGHAPPAANLVAPHAATGGRGPHILWALIPVLSLGVLLPFPFGYAARRLHSWKIWLITFPYALLWAILLPVIVAQGSWGHQAAAITASCWLQAFAIIATLHALWLRSRAFADTWSKPGAAR